MCLGSIAMEHVVIQSPKYRDTKFKGTINIVLFAAVDTNYNFTYVYIGCQKRISHAELFKNTSFAKPFSKETFSLPKNICLLEGLKPVPNVFLVDDPGYTNL